MSKDALSKPDKNKPIRSSLPIKEDSIFVPYVILLVISMVFTIPVSIALDQIHNCKDIMNWENQNLQHPDKGTCIDSVVMPGFVMSQIVFTSLSIILPSGLTGYYLYERRRIKRRNS